MQRDYLVSNLAGKWIHSIQSASGPDRRLITDEHQGCNRVGQAFKRGQKPSRTQRANASATGRTFTRGEGVFSLIKRGVMVARSISRKHIANYLNEFEFRWNTRKLNDGERVSRAIKQVDGKRLVYRESVDNPRCLVPAWEWRVQPKAPSEG